MTDDQLMWPPDIGLNLTLPSVHCRSLIHTSDRRGLPVFVHFYIF